MTALTEFRKVVPVVAVRRGGAVAAGALAALVVWGVEVEVIGGVRQPAFGDGPSQQLPAATVVAVSLVAGLFAWAALAATERFSRRGRRVWLTIVAAGLLASLAGPLSGTGVQGGDRVALLLLHLTVAAVVVPLLYRTAASSKSDQPR